MDLIHYPGTEEHQAEAIADPTSLSRRAARRLFQRAFVLAGRDRNVRQHIREASAAILFTIEDWDFSWTVILERGKLEFDRRPGKKPDLTLTWPTAEEFFRQAGDAARQENGPARAGDETVWRFARRVLSAFCAALRDLLRNPVDENGIRIA